MARGDDRELVEVAASLVPLAADGCTIDLVDDHALVCVAASHVSQEAERTLHLPAERSDFTAQSRCAIVSGGEKIGEVAAWGPAPLSPLAEALVCSAAAQVGALLEARACRHRARVLEAERSAIISMVGHEVRAPLQTLTVGVELLQMRVRDTVDEIPRDWISARCEQLAKSVSRLTDVAQRLLDVSRHDAGVVKLESRDSDLGALVTEVIERIRKDADWAGSPITVNDEGGLTGRWDRLHLETVIENLLTNAIKYGAGSPVTVNLTGDPSEVTIEVVDGGCGIRAGDVGRVFDRFFRGAAPGRQAGLGIGLWIVKRLVEAHDGTITCESVPGEGTVFRVVLPRRLSASEWVRAPARSLRGGPGR
ncbi:MAG: sensor histidine kinase [Labilithrix sp.]|nr:sensor histidine kinase [Labilithrix sp.]